MHLPAQASALPDPRLERALRHCVAIGFLLVLAVPAARGASTWFGALPLWLVAMPLVSWWALHRFRLPRRPRVLAESRRRRRGGAQARRRQGSGRPAFARAA
jgi:hypothetical protein